MAELSTDDATRAWVTFVDPADADQRFRCDLTWLTSRYECLFGRGCQGIDADRPDAGCCSLGAHFSEPADERRVARAVRRLRARHFQHRKVAREEGWVVDGPPEETPGGGSETPRQTRIVDGACIFHNGPDFSGGAGCALHLLAAEEGVSHVETKPDVCWQLPLRREFEEVERPDGRTWTEVVITEYTRSCWGPGGVGLDWYCTGSPDAHHAPDPLVVSAREELTALMGEGAYAVLLGLCEEHLARRPTATRHPADPPGGVDPSRILPVISVPSAAVRRGVTSR